MKHLAKRTLSLLLAALMVLSLIPAHTHVHAAEVTTAYYGADNTKDTNLTTTEEHSYGTVKNYVGSHSAWALKSGGMGLVLSEAFREGFNGKATVEVEYLSANTFSSTFDLQYIANDGSVKTPTEYTTKTGTTLSNQAANIRVYELTDMGTTLGTIGSVPAACSVAVTTTSTSYVGIRSIRVTKVADAPAYAPEFNEADFGGYVFDQVASPALTVKNPHTDVEMTARIYVTLKKDGKEILTQRRLRKHEDGPLPTDAPVEIFSAGDMTSGTSAAAKYDLVVTSFIKVNGGDEVQIEKTLSFERANTFTQRFYEENGDLYYAVRKVAGAENVAPNNFRITITGETLENPKVVNANGYAYSTEAETVKNLTKDVMSTFEPGTYTVTIEAAKDTKLRSTVSYTYTIAEPPAFEPAFGTISTVLDNAAVPELTIKNTSETSEMTTAIKATLKLNGELHPSVQNVSVGPEEPVAAGQTATLISTELLSKFATAKGNWEIVLTGTVTVDGVPYDVNETISFSRVATFTHVLDKNSDGDLTYTIQKVAAYEASAPTNFKIIVTNPETDEAVLTKTVQGYNYTADAESVINLTTAYDLINTLADGTYNVTVEAYSGQTLNATDAYKGYVIDAPAPEFAPTFNDAAFEDIIPDRQKAPALTITNPHATSEMTVTIYATLMYEGAVFNESIYNTEVASNQVVAAGEEYTLLTSQDLGVTGFFEGEYVLRLEGNVTVDGNTYKVAHVVPFERRNTFTENFYVDAENGDLYYAVQKVAGYENIAPQDFVFTITKNGNLSEPVVVRVEDYEYGTDAETRKNLTQDIMSEYAPGKYTIMVEAYRDDVWSSGSNYGYEIVAPACEHPNAKDDNDCTTAVVCPDCEAVVTPAKEAHTYTDDQDPSCNVCGTVRNIHVGTNATLGNSINLNVHVGLDSEKIESYTATITVNGQTQEAELNYNVENVYFVTLPGVAAKELRNEVIVTIYEGEEVLKVITDSFAAYADRLFKSDEANDNDKKMIADMVAYAAAAQDYFGYKTGEKSVIDQLADLNVDYTQYTDDVNPTCTDERAIQGERSLYQGSNFDLEDEITMNMYVRDVDYAVIEYIPYNGTETVTKTIQASECVKSNSYYKFKIDGFVTADGAHTVVTAKFYVNGNDEPVVTVTDSMASYVARQGATLTWLYTMQKYANSAYAALTD